MRIVGSRPLRAVLNRTWWGVSVLFGASLITFSLIYLLPADPAIAVAGPHADSETLEQIRRKLRLDDPLFIQYGHYILGVAQGDFGRSYITGERVSQAILRRLPATLVLALCGFVPGVVVGVLAGMLAAAKPRSLFARVVFLPFLLALSVPSFWLGILLLYCLAFKADLFPLGGSGQLSSVVLPSITLLIVVAPYYYKLMKTTLLEILSHDYIRTARGKGLGERRIVISHAARIAVLPVISMVGMDLPFLLGGVVFIETVFSWPGVGRLVAEAAIDLDVPVVMATVIITSFLVVMANLVVDLLHTLLDPRIDLD